MRTTVSGSWPATMVRVRASSTRTRRGLREVVEGWIEAEGGSVAFAGGELKSEDRGEGLHLDQARGERAISIAGPGQSRREEVR